MKILLVNDYANIIGGTEIYINTLREELIKKGHTVKMAAYKSKSNQNNYADYNLTSYKFRLLRDKLNPLYYFNVIAYYELKRIAEKFRPDIIHFHNINYNLSTSVLYAYEAKMFWTIHDTYIFFDKNKNANLFAKISDHIKKKIIEHGMKRTKIIAPSKFMCNKIKEEFLIEPAQIPNMIQKKKITKYNTNGFILYVGRVEKEKGIGTIIQAYALTLKRRKMPELIIVGEGKYKYPLIELCEKLHIEKRVRFEGYQTNVDKYYNQAGLFIMASNMRESFGMSVIESLSFGVPVIVTKSGALPELVTEGYNGYSIKNNDISYLANKILRFYNNNRRSIMSRNCVKISKDYTCDKIMQKVLKLYNE